MLSKGGNNEILAAWGEGNDPNAPVFGALDPADQALRDEAIDRALIEPGVRSTIEPIVLTGKGPLCNRTSSTPKSESRVRSLQYQPLRTV
jgi:hypothetical protein